jgi:TatD DNase family protein
MAKYIDTHAHLNFKDFKEDADEVIERSLEAETEMILVGSEIKTSKRAIEYANKYEVGVYAAIGLHPIHLEDIAVKNHNENGDYEFESHAEEFNYQAYYDLAHDNKKVVAIGEVGLDYFHMPAGIEPESVKTKQKKVLEEILLLAHNLKLPVIIHCREAHHDLLPLLTEFKNKYKASDNSEWGVIHCFSGDEKLANDYIKLGFLVSFTGLITFSKNWDSVIREIPLDKIMIETDSPYMAPTPYRGKRNEPLYVVEVARRIGVLKNFSVEEIGKITYENAKRLFKIN